MLITSIVVCARVSFFLAKERRSDILSIFTLLVYLKEDKELDSRRKLFLKIFCCSAKQWENKVPPIPSPPPPPPNYAVPIVGKITGDISSGASFYYS